MVLILKNYFSIGVFLNYYFNIYILFIKKNIIILYNIFLAYQFTFFIYMNEKNIFMIIFNITLFINSLFTCLIKKLGIL